MNTTIEHGFVHSFNRPFRKRTLFEKDRRRSQPVGLHKMELRILTVFAFLLLATHSVECSSKKVKSKVAGKILKNAADASNELEDPCLETKCTAGQECITDSETKEAKCVCVRDCQENVDPRLMVCSNFNETWPTDCHLLKRRCDCIHGSRPDCTDNHKHMHINYYGECKEIEPCKNSTLEGFPERMRTWLDNIIGTRLDDYANNPSRWSQASHWIDAIISKFCDSELEPAERNVSRHDLFPLQAPLLAKESCIAPFLDGCDANSDHKITLLEWTKCLGATEAEMDKRCNQYHAIKVEHSEL